ncbi:MAG TPA: SCO family protein [Caulobacteraceae bacterium]|nr:SCO family protein [Caulobacteraceae bacterium]
MMAFDPLQAAAIDGRLGGQVPMQAPLRDAAGQPVTLAALANGRPILLAPVQHRCKNLCGYTLNGLSDGLRQAGLTKVTVVAFGIDPRETSADSAATQARLPALHAVTAGETQIQAVTRALGYRFAYDAQEDQFAHLSAVAVLTPDGRLSSWLYGLQPPAPVLKAAIGAASQGGLGAVGQRILLLCYHYDPVSGRYTSRIETALKVSAVGAVLLLGGFVGLSLLRERRTRP